MPVQFTRRTRAQIRQHAGRLTGKMVDTGTCIATFATTTVVLAEAKKRPDDYYIGKRVNCYSGTNSGQVSVCTDSVQSTGTLTISPAWTSTPDGTSLIEIWEQDADELRVNDLINLAILQAKDFYVFSRQNPDSISSDEIKLALPATTPLVKLSRVYYELETGTNNEFEEYYRADSVGWLGQQQRGYAVAGSDIYLKPALPDGTLVGDIWLEGYKLPSVLSSDSATCDLPPAYVAYMTAFMLMGGNMQGNELDPESHGSQAALWYRMAQADIQHYRTRVLPNTQDLDA